VRSGFWQQLQTFELREVVCHFSRLTGFMGPVIHCCLEPVGRPKEEQLVAFPIVRYRERQAWKSFPSGRVGGSGPIALP
jgi:hypothetical protein